MRDAGADVMMRHWLPRVLIVAGALYVCALLGLVLFGRMLIYHPDPAVIAASADAPATIEEIRLKTPDGETLRGWWMPPAEGKPVLLFFDGNGGRLHMQEPRFAKAAEEGVGVLSFAYRGYSGSTGRPTEKALHADARLAYDWLRSKVDADRIVIHGFSLGTGVATELATEVPERALVLEAPYTALIDLAAARPSIFPIRLLMQDQFLSREWIANVHAPVLIVHGDADKVIPVAHGEKLFALAHEPKQFVRVPGGGHSDLIAHGLYDRIWTFLKLSPAEAGDGG